MTRWLVLAFLTSLAVASPSVLHEKRIHDPIGWERVKRHLADSVLPLRFGLMQSNLDKLEELLLDVSHPESPSYGNHWSASQVAKTFAPSKETVDAVRTWLSESGISGHRLASGQGWIEVNATVEEAERLLGTEYYVYSHSSGKEHVGKLHFTSKCDQQLNRGTIACDAYHLPEHVAHHIDVVTPSVHFDTPAFKRRDLDPKSKTASSIGKPHYGTVSPKSVGIVKNLVDELENCNTHVSYVFFPTQYVTDGFNRSHPTVCVHSTESCTLPLLHRRTASA
jgi:tripeptidyl-peptidase I